jgi:hypothetical protein
MTIARSVKAVIDVPPERVTRESYDRSRGRSGPSCWCTHREFSPVVSLKLDGVALGGLRSGPGAPWHMNAPQ